MEYRYGTSSTNSDTHVTHQTQGGKDIHMWCNF